MPNSSDAPVYFTLVTEKDLKKMRFAKDVISIAAHQIWLGTCDGNTFTSEKKGLYDPSRKAWFVLDVSWKSRDEQGAERIATNGEIFTYVRQSLQFPRVPFTDTVKREINWTIDHFWRNS